MNRHIYTLLFTFLLVSSPTANSQSPSCKAANCIPIMLQSISPINESQLNAAADLALNKDAFPKGNRKEARKLNEEGLKQLNSGNPQSAANTLKQAVETDPSDVEINSNYGFALLKAGNYAGAKAQLQKTLELNPRRTSTWLPLAEAYAGTGQAQVAKQAGLIAYHFSTDKSKAKAYYQKQSQEQSIAPIRSMYTSLNQEVSKLDSAQTATGTTTSTTMSTSPAPTKKSATNPDQIFQTFASNLGPIGWGKCMAGQLAIVASSVRGDPIPAEYLKKNDSLGTILGKVRQILLSRGVPQDALDKSVKSWMAQIRTYEQAPQWVNECVDELGRIAK